VAEFGTNVDEDLTLLDNRMKLLRTEYEQYFLGSRPREPQLLRGEVQKMVTTYANLPITSTRHRFRFNNLRARFFALRRHWDEILRRIEEGRYERHLFKADLRSREQAERRGGRAARPAEPAAPAGDDIFEAYVAARRACGQSVEGLTRQKLEAILRKQGEELRGKLGCTGVTFRVAVEDGQARLKARPVQ
jgi:hypothetical protein